MASCSTTHQNKTAFTGTTDGPVNINSCSQRNQITGYQVIKIHTGKSCFGLFVLFISKIINETTHMQQTRHTIFRCVLYALFSLRKSCLKFCAYITREHKISKFFSEAFSGAKTNDNCIWTSKTLHRSNTVRNCFLWIPSKLQLMFFRLKIVVLFIFSVILST